MLTKNSRALAANINPSYKSYYDSLFIKIRAKAGQGFDFSRFFFLFLEFNLKKYSPQLNCIREASCVKLDTALSDKALPI